MQSPVTTQHSATTPATMPAMAPAPIGMVDSISLIWPSFFKNTLSVVKGCEVVVLEEVMG